MSRDVRYQARGVGDRREEEARCRAGNESCEVSGASAAAGGGVQGSNKEKGADLSEVVSAELRLETPFSHGRKEVRRVGVVRKRKTNRAPARLMKRTVEARRQQESVWTQHAGVHYNSTLFTFG